MPEITLVVDTSEGQRKIGVLADSLKDLTPILKAFDKYKRAKIAELFQTQGHGQWAPQSEGAAQKSRTRAKGAEERGEGALVRKLHRERRRAFQRAERKDRKVGLLRSFGAKARDDKARRWNAVARRAFVLRTFEARLEAGATPTDTDVVQAARFAGLASDKRLLKSIGGLDDRLARAVGRVKAKANLLGDLPRTIRSVVKNGQLVIDSTWQSPAVRALNDGATVGRGAKLPPREFLFWETDDVEHFIGLLKERAMLAWQS